jgi:capsular polysaccharide biosynthesis protein
VSVDPRIAVAVVISLLVVVVARELPPSTHEASAQAWVDYKQQANPAGTFPTIIHTIDSRPVAEEAIGRLGLQAKPAELLSTLAVEPVENTSFIRLTYEGTVPVKDQQIVNTLAKVASERISERSNLRATVYEEQVVPEPDPKPFRNGLNSKSGSRLEHPIIKTPLSPTPKP